ncbi:hypothetical protein KI811_14255 [Geobacter hydrogenophilus]|uniref:Uncharacterized protein n=1 Tax=Geobacter hydrogenophilus TaxID=40983 RepID=A0A9W6FY60_9BACT|nr:hypothetical protein [Geobacter hydrogenophilus]MBT0894973.1 hypothetical protein [Geobacter hydrogenophilus]GLI37056.1 hypothetical protein GHYDROH2_05570 [Geobacter hydrogenophilus]
MRARLLFLLLISVITIVVAGCGGGGADSNTTGILSAAPSATAVAAGKSLTVTATYTHPTNSAPSGVPITFSDASGIFASTTAYTGPDGKATALLNATNVILADQTVTIVASTGGLRATCDVTVKADKLNVVAAGDEASFTDANTPQNTSVRFVSSGDFITLADGDGLPLANRTVTIKVHTIVNAGDGTGTVLYWQGLPVDLSSPPATITATTDSAGNIAPQYSVDMPIPNTKSSNVIAVVFEAQYGNIITRKSALYTATRN